MLRASALVALVSAFVPAMGGTAAADHHYDYLLASQSKCPNQTNRALSATDQERVMTCMHNHARKKAGKPSLRTHGALTRSAGKKADDMWRCGVTHYPCGDDMWRRIREEGYMRGCYGVGENIAWGSGDLGDVRSIMSAWLNSKGHRRNILNGRFRDVGIGLVKGPYGGYRDAQIWATHFGYQC